MKIITELAAGFALDCLIGDPPYPWHPVRLIGRLISGLEKFLRRHFPESRRGLQAAGTVLVILVCLISTALPALLLAGLAKAGSIPEWIAGMILCGQLLAARSLRDESMKVCTALEQGDIEKARRAVSMIVGRDTSVLDGAGINRAAVETVAENASDGVMAPMFYMAAGGVPLLFLYKAVNTMDSMVGYKNDTYIWFGRTAARLDDVMNFIPARLSGLLMIPAAALCGLDWRGCARIFFRDRKKHASPNSAHTEAAAAGALGIQLAGDAVYFGKRVAKPTLGDAGREIEPADIRRANRLMYTASVLALLLFVSVRALLTRVF